AGPTRGRRREDNRGGGRLPAGRWVAGRAGPASPNQVGVRPMIRRHWVWVVPVAAALTTAVVWPSRAQEPPKTTTEKIKAKVGSAVDSIKRGAASAEGAIKEQYARARSGVIAMGIEARVYARLHWDKALYGTKIDLSWPKEGVITLSGMVPDER